MRIPGLHEKTSELLRISLILTVIMTYLRHGDACGSYGTVDPGGTYYIASPANYGAYQHCLWWIQAKEGYILTINFTFEGQHQYGRCGDYITIRDGSSTSTALLDQSCNNYTNHVINATARTLWIQFKSDGLNYTNGFQAYLTSQYAADPAVDVTNPVIDCKSHEFECTNRVCLTRSYRCDGYNDCGCDEGCDEDDCSGLTLDRLALIAIGISVGFAIFIAFFFFAFAYETHLKRKAAMADPEAQTELQKQKDGKKRKKDKKKAQRDKKKGGWTG